MNVLRNTIDITLLGAAATIFNEFTEDPFWRIMLVIGVGALILFIMIKQSKDSRSQNDA
jgi:TRAP-type uncharacterized transport system fused permease subunit